VFRSNIYLHLCINNSRFYTDSGQVRFFSGQRRAEVVHGCLWSTVCTWYCPCQQHRIFVVAILNTPCKIRCYRSSTRHKQDTSIRLPQLWDHFFHLYRLAFTHLGPSHVRTSATTAKKLISNPSLHASMSVSTSLATGSSTPWFTMTESNLPNELLTLFRIFAGAQVAATSVAR